MNGDKPHKAYSYGRHLEENIEDLIQRIRRGRYQPKPARIVEIPKEDGSTRPLAISCLEDKLVQASVSTILSKIYEPLFLTCSYGFREGKSCHEALKALSQATFKNWDGAIVEIDIRKYFNTIPHEELMQMLRNKVSDKRFIRLIEILMKAPILEDGKEVENTRGCPQGSIISPILANIYLHFSSGKSCYRRFATRDFQFSWFHMPLGQDKEWLLATEIYQPQRPIHYEAERNPRVS